MVQLPDPSDPGVNGGGDDYSPRDSDVQVLATVDEATYAEDDGNDGPTTTTRSRGAPTSTAAASGTRAWATPQALVRPEPQLPPAHPRRPPDGHRRRASDCGEPRQAPPDADDFELVTIDDDTESPMELAVAKDGRVFYVERITGELNVYNPANGDVMTAGDDPGLERAGERR